MVKKIEKEGEIITPSALPQDYFKAIFSEFEQQGIRYCALRNFEFLYDVNHAWEGLDIVIGKDDYEKARAILQQQGFIQRKPQFSLQHKAFFKLVNGIKVSFDVQVGGVHWNDMRYMDESIIADRMRKDFFYVPSDNDTFLMLLVHSILGKRRFKPKYQEILSSLLEQGKIDEQKTVQDLSRVFTKQESEELLKLVKAKQFDKIPIYYLLFIFVGKRFNHLATLSALTLRWVKWKRPLMPAPLISIVGPDGAGKSTLVNSLHGYLLENRRKPVIVYMGRGRSHLLPFMGLARKYKSAEKKRDAQVTDHSSHSFKRKMLYSISSVLFVADSWLRYWLVVFPLRMCKRLVITDRYCTDIILMKNVPLWWRKLLYSLFPRPTISVLLYNTPEVLHQRRPEETIAELQRQMDIFNKLNYDLRMGTKSQEEDKWKVIGFVTSRLLVDWY
ncbi:MAG: nucleotidyltransferase family protein [Nanoarchaeota archaeon]|nr:nucleotidyltransferase family protein [Nanoarchaeota archaeon]